MQELNTQFIKKKKNEKWSIKIEKKARLFPPCIRIITVNISFFNKFRKTP